MKIVEPSVNVVRCSGVEELKLIELAARTCYKSEDRITEDSYLDMLDKLCKPKGGGVPHTAMLEFGVATVKLVCDRGVSHELVRHRIGVSFAQESTRYCNYSKGKYNSEITVVRPCFWPEGSVEMAQWESAMLAAEGYYLGLLGGGATAQQARSVLPNSLKTEVVMQANFTSWLHIFRLRCAPNAHPQMRQIMDMVRNELRARVPKVFDEN